MSGLTLGSGVLPWTAIDIVSFEEAPVADYFVAVAGHI
jgi:hypothetical protein